MRSKSRTFTLRSSLWPLPLLYSRYSISSAVYIKFRFILHAGSLVLAQYLVILLFYASLVEEVPEEGGGLGLEDAAGVGVSMVEAGVCGKVVEGAGGACFGVGGGVDEEIYRGGVEGAGADVAGFEGDVEGAGGETPASEVVGGAADGEEFGVGCRVSRSLALVVGGDE